MHQNAGIKLNLVQMCKIESKILNIFTHVINISNILNKNSIKCTRMNIGSLHSEQKFLHNVKKLIFFNCLHM